MRDAALPRRPVPRRTRPTVPLPVLPAVVRKHPGTALAATVFAVGLAGIVANATFFQKSRHPAPLFAGPARTGPVAAPAAVLPPPRPPTPAVMAVVPTPAEAPQGAAIASTPPPRTPASRKTEAAPARTLEHTAAAPHTTPAPHPPDGIGRLIESGAGAGPRPGATPDGPTVLTAQKALAALGYPVKPDGKMGETTRQALASFQRDHRLPPAEGLTPKLLRQLAAAAGAPPG